MVCEVSQYFFPDCQDLGEQFSKAKLGFEVNN